jgi:hypothetical protein
MRAFTILGIHICRCRVRRTRPWPVIDRIAPQSPGFSSAAARIQHRQCRVVRKHLIRRQHRADHQVIKRPEPPAGSANPVAQRRAVQIDALSRQHLGLPMQRQQVAIFADQQVHHHCLGRQAAIDGALRCRRLYHGPLTGPAGVTRPARDPHPELCGHNVELRVSPITCSAPPRHGRSRCSISATTS